MSITEKINTLLEGKRFDKTVFKKVIEVSIGSKKSNITLTGRAWQSSMDEDGDMTVEVRLKCDGYEGDLDKFSGTLSKENALKYLSEINVKVIK